VESIGKGDRSSGEEFDLARGLLARGKDQLLQPGGGNQSFQGFSEPERKGGGVCNSKVPSVHQSQYRGPEGGIERSRKKAESQWL